MADQPDVVKPKRQISQHANRLIINLIMSVVMSLLMSFVQTSLNVGFGPHFLPVFARSAGISMVISFCVIYFTLPLLTKALAKRFDIQP